MIQDSDWQLQSALDREPHQRACSLDEACVGDQALRQQVEARLGADRDASDFLERPALNVGASLATESEGASLEGRRSVRIGFCASWVAAARRGVSGRAR